jgi:DNA-binding PadR family transcriptional regulator
MVRLSLKQRYIQPRLKYIRYGYIVGAMAHDKALAPLTPAVLHILLALSTGARHGYGIMKQVKADSGGKVRMGAGTLYGSLRRMIDSGLIRETDKRIDREIDDERRIYYEITALGQQSLAAELQRYREVVAVAGRRRLSPKMLALAREYQLLRYRRWYARLLCLYPKSFRERFRESMEQTFCDVCRAHASTGRGLFGLALWLCVETVGGIMSEHIRLSIMRHGSVVRAAWVTAGVLLIPLWGIFSVDGWNWDWRGFVVAGAFVFSAALTFELVVKRMNNKAYRFAMGLAVATAFVLTWVNFVLAVDVSLANFMYFGVVVVGLVGAAIARLRARGMALALTGMAIAQILVPFIALVFWKTRVALGAAIPVVGLNGVFIVLFAISALLFRRAARNSEMPPTQFV